MENVCRLWLERVWAALLGKVSGCRLVECEYGKAFGQFADGSGAQFAGLGHGASGVIGGEQVATLQFGASAAMTLLIHCGRDAIFHLDGRIVGKGMAESWTIQRRSPLQNHAQPDNVVGRVE